jgi:uncharacterized membrane protein YdjX (TVP38/TMEM64 family)
MPILKKLSKKTKTQVVAVLFVIFALVVLLACDVIFGGPLTTLLGNKGEIVDFVRALGILGPVAFMALQALTTIIAPIPSNVIGLVGGFLFGWWGVLWTTVGSAFGAYVVFLISRRFGRPFVAKIFKKDLLNKFDHLTEEKGSFIFFMIFLLPGLPDDLVCYIAGLTKIPIKKLVAMFVLGRTPAVVVTNLIGMQVGESDIRPLVFITLVVVLVLAAIAWKREKIMGLVNKDKK